MVIWKRTAFTHEHADTGTSACPCWVDGKRQQPTPWLAWMVLRRPGYLLTCVSCQAAGHFCLGSSWLRLGGIKKEKKMTTAGERQERRIMTSHHPVVAGGSMHTEYYPTYTGYPQVSEWWLLAGGHPVQWPTKSRQHLWLRNDTGSAM